MRFLKTVFAAMLLLAAAVSVNATEIPNDDETRKDINLGQVKVPNPHMFLIDEPEAWYNTTSGSLCIQLDATAYSAYVITISSDYASLDYYPTSSLVIIPAAALSEITNIYIDSNDCGAYEGVLDMNAVGNMY